MMAEVFSVRPEAHLLTFTQGLIVGQLSVILLLVVFVKFFIFGDTPSPEAVANVRMIERQSRTLAYKESLFNLRDSRQRQQQFATREATTQPTLQKKSAILHSLPPTHASIGAILNKTYYRVYSHQPESLDWFNVLIAQTIAQFRSDAQHDDAILKSLTKSLNSPSRPEYIDEIKVTELSLGDDFPIFSNCRIVPVDEDGFDLDSREREKVENFHSGRFYPTRRNHRHGFYEDPAAFLATAGPSVRLQARMDVDLSDVITLGLETKLVLNFPQPRTAILPVALAVSVVRFSGTLRISFIPSNALTSKPTMMTFSFLDDYRLDLSIRSLVGSRSRLQDVPKIAQLIESRLHRWFDERAVEPRFQEIALPSLWPRKKNTRGPESTGTDAAPMPNPDEADSTPDSVGCAKDFEIRQNASGGGRSERDGDYVSRVDHGTGIWRKRKTHLSMDDDEFSMPGFLPNA